jgi:DNA-binding transcriptional ArsR family regulator
MKGKTSLPPLPPLSLQALHDVELIEDAVQDALEGCINQVRNLVNPEKASRILRTCLVESLRVQIDYYSSLPGYHPIWIAHILKRTIDSMIALFPVFTSGEQFRGELIRTATDYLRSRPLNFPKPKLELKSGNTAPPINEQLEVLRKECRMTVEDLAEGIGLTPRSVYRHLSGEAVPRARQVAAYEKLFSKRFGKLVNIETSLKRQ